MFQSLNEKVSSVVKWTFLLFQLVVLTVLCIVLRFDSQSQLPLVLIWDYSYSILALFALVGVALSGLSGGRTEWTSVVFAMVLFSLGVELYLLVMFVPHRTVALDELTSGAVLGLTLFNVLSPLLGHISIITLLALALVFAPVYCLIEFIGAKLMVSDPSGIFKVHIFGGLVGTALTSLFHKQLAQFNNNLLLKKEEQHALSLLGSFVCSVCLPFVILGSLQSNRHAVIINVFLAQIGSACSSFLSSVFFSNQVNPPEMMLASVVGGVVIGPFSPRLHQPQFALVIGCIAGLLMTLLSTSKFLSSLEQFQQEVVETIHKTVIGSRPDDTLQSRYEPSRELNQAGRAQEEARQAEFEAKTRFQLMKALSPEVKYQYYDPALNMAGHVIPGLMGALISMMLSSAFPNLLDKGTSPRSYSKGIILMTVASIGLAFVFSLIVSGLVALRDVLFQNEDSEEVVREDPIKGVTANQVSRLQSELRQRTGADDNLRTRFGLFVKHDLLAGSHLN